MLKEIKFSLIIILIVSCSCLMLNDDLINIDSSKKDTNYIPDYIDGIKNIKHNLERESIDLFEAYIEVSRYMKSLNMDSVEYKESNEFLNEIIEIMDKKVSDEFESKKYDDALMYALSLKAIDKQSSISLKNIYSKFSEYLDASGDMFSQFDIKEEMADNLLLSDEDVYKMLKKHANNNSRGVFLYQIEKYSKIYPDLINQYPDLIRLKEKMENSKDLNFEKLMKSVVLVLLDKGLTSKQGMEYPEKAIGTGFFIDNNGYILTNHHVIADHVNPKYKGFTAVKVFTKERPDGPPYPAEVIGYDKVFDIALLKIPVKNNNYLTLGRSVDMSVGDKIYTIGNPLGIQHTITAGIISNKDIYFFQLGRCFMIDAAINPGNSGGPLIDDRGQVVGIVFASAPDYQGINFAIPFEWVRKTITALYKKGEVKRCWIGGGIYNKDNEVYFYYILPEGPAEKSGIKVEDKLVKIDGIEIKSVEEAQSLLAWRKYPRLMEIETERDGKIYKNIVRLEQRNYQPIETIFNNDTIGNIFTLLLGVKLEYYDKNFFSKKYKTTKIYRGIINPILNLDINLDEGIFLAINEIKYIEKEESVVVSFTYKQKEAVFDKTITLKIPVQMINKII